MINYPPNMEISRRELIYNKHADKFLINALNYFIHEFPTMYMNIVILYKDDYDKLCSNQKEHIEFRQKSI